MAGRSSSSVGAPTDDEVHALLQTLIARLMKMRTRRSVLVEDGVRQPLCADIDGFSLHAAARVEAHDRKRLEQLCRYIARPALSEERIQVRPHRIGWARLLERVLAIDMPHCPNGGGGELKLIAAILQRPVVQKILTHLGLDPQPPPPRAGARGWTGPRPPQPHRGAHLRA